MAFLARIRLEGEELSRMAGELDGILAYVRQLQSVPTDHVEPTSHVLPLANVMRADEVRPSLSQEVVLAMAPAVQHPYVKVPKVIE